MNVSDIQNLVEIAIAGKSASQLYEENKSFDITVRLPEENRNSVEAIGNILVPRQPASMFPLVSWPSEDARRAGPDQPGGRPAENRHRDEHSRKGHREFCGRSQTEDQAEKVKLPSGYYLTWGGQFENQQRAMAKMMIIGPVAIGLILLLLFATFRSIKLALLVIPNLPFALIGGVFALWISGQYLSVPASVGFVVLFGVAVLNGVVLVSRISQLREEGVELDGGDPERQRPLASGADDGLHRHFQPDTHAFRRWSGFGNPETPGYRGGGGIGDLHAADALAHSVHVRLV